MLENINVQLLLTFFIFLLVLILVISVLISTQSNSSTSKENMKENKVLKVQGSGKVEVIPNETWLQLGVQNQETTAFQAWNTTSQQIQKVLTFYKENVKEISEKENITTLETSNNPVYSSTNINNTNETKIIGYMATYTIQIKLKTEQQKEKAGYIVDETSNLLGNSFRLNNISFHLSNEKRNNVEKEARILALKATLEKAKDLEEHSQGLIKLGSIQEINETSLSFSSYSTSASPEYSFVKNNTTPVLPGILEITVDLNLIYSLL